MSSFIEVKNLKKSFDDKKIEALRGINLNIERTDFLAVMGPSGCGKSTLLNMVGALDKPEEGEIVIDGETISNKNDLDTFRRKRIGFVFQLHNLIPTLTAIENVQIPMFGSGLSARERREKAKMLLEKVGLAERENNLPTKLSGGERQKVAIARALANDPEIVIADEPTGNLDSKSTEGILKLLREIHERDKNTIIMVTHDQKVAEAADRIVYMLDGLIRS